MLEEQLQKFVDKEEFDDEEECMMEIQRLVKEDLEKVRGGRRRAKRSES
jgi:hypothetical protein